MSFKPLSSSSSSPSSILLQCLSRPGPSRLAASRTRPCPSCRRAASTSVDSEPITPGSPEAEAALLGGTPSSAPSVEQAATDEIAGQGRSRGFGAASGRNNDDARNARVKPDAPGYQNWLKSVATLYREPPSNGPNWLGKEIPYPSNPSFRPPPPLSNDLKDLIYSEVYTGGSSSSAILSTLESLSSSTKKSSNSSSTSTSSSSSSSNASSELQKRINRVSEEFGISKKRVEAVLKLKEHERGMKERGEIMQTPFLTSMEKFLAVRPIRPKNTPATTRSWAWESQERAFRRNHPSTSLEASEESAHEAYSQGKTVGQDSSAFTTRDTIEAERGVERAVWEFRDSSLSAEQTRPDGTGPLDVPYNRVFTADDVAQQTNAKQSGRQERNATRRQTPNVGQDAIQSELVDRVVLPKKNSKSAVFSFVNTADPASTPSTKGGLSSVGRGKMQNEHGQREKKARRSERVQKAKQEMAQRQASKGAQ